jgi:hypothetical protein
LAITTIFDSDNYANTSLAILKEFIQTYIAVDVTFNQPIIDETEDPETILQRPMIWIQYLPDDFREIGMGRAAGNNQKGQKGYLSFWVWYYFADHLGGLQSTFEMVAQMKSIFNEHKEDLSAAKLKNAQIGNFRPIYKELGMTIYGGRQMITTEIPLRW